MEHIDPEQVMEEKGIFVLLGNGKVSSEEGIIELKSTDNVSRMNTNPCRSSKSRQNGHLMTSSSNSLRRKTLLNYKSSDIVYLKSPLSIYIEEFKKDSEVADDINDRRNLNIVTRVYGSDDVCVHPFVNRTKELSKSPRHEKLVQNGYMFSNNIASKGKKLLEKLYSGFLGDSESLSRQNNEHSLKGKNVANRLLSIFGFDVTRTSLTLNENSDAAERSAELDNKCITLNDFSEDMVTNIIKDAIDKRQKQRISTTSDVSESSKSVKHKSKSRPSKKIAELVRLARSHNDKTAELVRLARSHNENVTQVKNDKNFAYKLEEQFWTQDPPIQQIVSHMAFPLQQEMNLLQEQFWTQDPPNQEMNLLQEQFWTQDPPNQEMNLLQEQFWTQDPPNQEMSLLQEQFWTQDPPNQIVSDMTFPLRQEERSHAFGHSEWIYYTGDQPQTQVQTQAQVQVQATPSSNTNRMKTHFPGLAMNVARDENTLFPSKMDLYMRSHIWENLDEGCAICLESPIVGEIVCHFPCLHKYHKHCIDRWLKKLTTCPICKSSIT